MKTIIFDIDGTLTNIWPIEKSVLLRMTKGRYEDKMDELKKSGISDTYKIFLKVSSKRISKRKYFSLYNQSFLKLVNLPKLVNYPIIDWIKKNRDKYIFVYATGGQKVETEYVLTQLGVINYFDLKNSVDKSNCRFSKKTSIPFRKIKSKYEDCILITDSDSDGIGASKAGIRFIKIKSNEKFKGKF